MKHLFLGATLLSLLGGISAAGYCPYANGSSCPSQATSATASDYLTAAAQGDAQAQ